MMIVFCDMTCRVFFEGSPTMRIFKVLGGEEAVAITKFLVENSTAACIAKEITNAINVLRLMFIRIQGFFDWRSQDAIE